MKTSMFHAFARIALAFSLLILPALWISIPAQAQGKIHLTAQGNKFCINGTPEFLVLASYFDALDAAYLEDDLDYLKEHGIAGIRIFPNWWDEAGQSSHTLFDPSGQVRPDRMRRLKAVLKAATVRNMIVDITFTRETVPGLQAENYKKGIAATVRQLKRYDNILYDLQNERNGDRTRLSGEDIIALRSQLKAMDPSIILSASEAYEATPEQDIAFVKRTGMDIINYHEPRGGAWWDMTADRVKALRTFGKPVYLGEPGRWMKNIPLTAANLTTALEAAKRSGAAAWTFHSEASFDLDHASLRSRLNPAVEQAFLDSLPQTLQRTAWGIQ